MSTDGLTPLLDSVGLYVRSADEVELRTGTTNGERLVLSDGDQRGLLAGVLERLADQHGRELNAEEQALLDELVPQLRECGLVDDRSDSRGARSLLHRPIAEVEVTIVGDGHLGARIGQLLAPLGFARLTHVRSSGTARATPRVEAAARPGDAAAWRSELADAGWVIAAQDCFEPEELRAIDDERLASCRPWSLVCLDGREAWVGPTFAPGITPCFGCYERRLLSSPKQIRNVLGEPGIRLVRLPGPGDDPWSGVRISYVASLFAMDIAGLVDGKGFTVGAMVVINLATLAMNRESVLRIPRCPTCSRARGGPAENIFASIIPSAR